MPIWLSMFLSLGGSTLIALIVTLIFNKFKDGTKKAIQRRNESTREEMRTIIREENESIKSQLNDLDGKIDTIQEGTKCSLRTSILNSYYDCLTKGYRTNEDSENMEKLLDAYYSLHGNSFVQHTIEPEFRRIKTKDEYEEEQRKQRRKKQVLVESYED